MNIIVSGASRGIGFELVREFARSGKHSIIGISRNRTGLEELYKVCKEESPASMVHTIPFDLLETSRIRQELVPAISKFADNIDILVNNAGILINRSFSDLSLEDHQHMLNVNLTAPFFLIQGLLPLLQLTEMAHVLNICSMGGVQGSAKFPGLSAYSASKGALAILSECLAEEYKESGIRFNALALGSVQTNMLDEAFPGYKADVNAAEMAKFIRNFALNAGRFINGKIIPVTLSTP